MESRQTAVVIGGPFFEDLERGEVYEAPAMTVGAGHAAIHQAIAGDRLALGLDAELCREVTGSGRPLIHPNLVCDVAIGQSTAPTQRVLGNLFYRGLVLLRPVFEGDTLRTRTEVVALKQNRPRSDGTASGLAVLRIQTRNQAGDPILDFYRCPMLPMRDPQMATGHADGFDSIAPELDMGRVRAAVPDWRYERLREAVPDWRREGPREGVSGLPHEGPREGVPEAKRPAPGTTIALEGRDTVTSAPELARLTLNLAMTHRDPGAGAHGRRLVYGGQTISMAAAAASAALPGLVTIVAWRSCEHSAPVFEGDVLSFELAVEEIEPLQRGAGLADLRAIVHADRGTGEEPEQVLDWRFLAVLA
ncbi:MAG: MaoC family dehydratase [Solirubrobacterales bacterium]